MLASMVRDIADVTIIDAYSHALSTDDTVKLALEFNPDIIGIGLPFTFTEPAGKSIAAGLKASNPELKIILGGIQATINADGLLENPAVDAVVLCEAELTVRELAEQYNEHGWNGVVNSPPAGLKIRSGTDVISGDSRSFIKDIDSLPFPSFDLLPGFPDFYSARILTSRGCRFKCPYCASAGYWRHKYRAHSPARVIEMLMNLRDSYGISRVSFADDTFNFDPARAKEIAELIIKNCVNMEWGASCRPELLTVDDLRLYSEAGMTGLFLGLESGSPRILKGIRRSHDLEVTRDLVGYAESIDIETHASFMIGLPDETDEDVEMTLEYARNLPSGTLGFHIFHPLPGSEYGDNTHKYGLEFDVTPDTGGSLGAIDGVAPIKTRHLSVMRILDYYQIARGIAEDRIRERKDTQR